MSKQYNDSFKRFIILAATLAALIGACTGPKPGAPGPDAGSAVPPLGLVDLGSVELELEIVPPPSAYQYPFRETLHSYPIILQFNFEPKDWSPDSASKAAVKPTAPLYRLEYTVKANPAPWDAEPLTPTPISPVGPQATDVLEAIPGDELTLPFIPPYNPCFPSLFGDRLDLYGSKGPGFLQVSPPVVIPPGTTALRVCAWLSYLDPSGEVQTLFDHIDFSVSEPDGSRRYLRYRDGYLRGHLLSVGRGLSWVWLRQYEPSVDPKDLLYNSRAIVESKEGEPDYQATLYVPWVAPDGAIHGGDENPLLRGGLAMATFALEYLATGNPESLGAALDLLRYVEASEWKDSSGEGTGFFLRSRWPGDTEDDGSSPLPFYASTDEIVGMTLGLYYLHEALEQAGRDTDRARVEVLVTHLGRHLRDNYFFIVPPADPRLPQERHKGWSGTHFFQWFLNGGFKAITGESFEPTDALTADSAEWNRMKALPWNGPEEDEDVELIEKALKVELTAKERALLSIQGIGAQMYWGGQDYLVDVTVWCPVPCLIGCYFGDVAQVPAFDQWNFPMLLHVFQLGMADSELRDSETVREVRTEMGRLIAGVLGTETIHTTIPLKNLAIRFKGLDPLLTEMIVALGAACFASVDDTIEVGEADAVADYYAAAIAEKYGLFDYEHSYGQLAAARDGEPAHQISPEFWSCINGGEGVTAVQCRDPEEYEANLNSLLHSSIEQVRKEMADSLPVGKPDHESLFPDEAFCRRVTSDPNPEDKIGQAFSWEKKPGNRIQSGSTDHGVTNMKVYNLWQTCRDLLKEGAGLDYLLPTMLIEEQRNEVSQQVLDGIDVPERVAFRYPLPVCTSFPFYASDSSFHQPPCEYPWPRLQQDPYESYDREGNDLIETGQQLQCGTLTGLTIDRSTLYARGTAGKRQPPVSGTYFEGSPDGDPAKSLSQQSIWSTDDIDYFWVNCDPGSPLLVEVVVESEELLYHSLVVDGFQTTSSSITVQPSPTHTIMFTGDAVTYTLHISPVP